MKLKIIDKCLASLVLCLTVLILWGCDKDFLDARPDKSLLVPVALNDYQALLDNSLSIMNRTPYLGEVAADDFYMAPNSFSSYQDTERNCYVWSERLYSTPFSSDWDIPYKQIFYSNVVLEGLQNFSSSDQQVRNVKGMALFYRAWALFQAAQLFAQPYSDKSVALAPGIPVRTSPDVNLISERGTLSDTYEQIRSDIEEAIPLLKIEQDVPTRPSKTAAYALMARLQLVMQDYMKAKLYADSTLVLYNELIDYNHLDSAKAYPMPQLYLLQNRNPEVIFLTILNPNVYFGSSNNTLIDTTLYKTYQEHDLRRTLLFTASHQFRGSYMGMKAYQFSGLAVDEVYLIRAEANARLGDPYTASADLNTLLVKRWKHGFYKPVSSNDSVELLSLILKERRKELIARGVRWSDLRRLNFEDRFAKTIQRDINGTLYSLIPGDKRYTFPIPDGEIAASGIKQNER